MSSITKDIGHRLVLFPIQYATVWSMYKKAQSAFWTAEEIDLSKDLEDWLRLSANERTFVKQILAFFAASDSIVNENLAVRFMNEIEVQEVKSFYGFQIAMENIHCVAGDTYVLTDRGQIQIEKLDGRMERVWNGVEWSTVTVMKTSDASPACKVILDNGVEIVCTPNHEWIMKDGSRKMCDLLEIGDEIAAPAYPAATDFDATISDPEIFTNPKAHGFLSLEFPVKSKYDMILYNFRGRASVPINYGRRTKELWLEGAAEHLSSEGVWHHTDRTLLREVQLLLVTLGRHSVLTGPSPFGEEVHSLKLLDVDEVPASLQVTHLAVSSGTCAMYCFEEPKRHTGCFNGVITGQSETYSLLLDTYIKDKEERTHLLNAVETVPSIKKKADWAMRWIKDAESTFAKRLVAFACVEGIFFSGAFCAIFWLKERGVMPGLCLSNEFISRDESLHTEFAIHLHSLLPKDERLDPVSMKQIVEEAVAIEIEFINDSISCEMLGMNAELMATYIKFVADRLIVQLDQEKIWNVKNPFPFMERISLSQKANFFEHTRQSDYAKAQAVQEFSLDSDF